MQKIIVSILLASFITSCAYALLTPRAFPERRYRPCQAGEVGEGISPIGKLCHRYCAKYRALRTDISENCKEWTTDVKDFSKESDFLEFRSAGFIMIREDRLN